MIHLPASDALCALPHPYCPDSVPAGLFERAMAEISRFHCRHTAGYEHWLNAHGHGAHELDTLDDWSRLPPIFANFFKQRLLLSSTGADALELTSSGTSGQRSRMRYDERSLGAAQFMVAQIFRYYGWDTPDTPCNYLLLSYEPQGQITLGTSFTDQFLCRFAPANRVVYALRSTGDGHQFDVFGVIQALQAFSEEGLPVRIIGFPAFLWQTLQQMQALGMPDLKLRPFTGIFRRWLENQAPHEIPGNIISASTANWALKPRVSRWLRRRRACRALHRMRPSAFHVRSIQRCTCASRGFSFQSLRPAGLLGFVSPYISSSPAHAVVMSDLATLHPGGSCDCGLSSDWFELHGRAGTTAGRSCAMAAAELLGGY